MSNYHVLSSIIIGHIGEWSKEAIELIEDITLCAKWEPVMIKVTDHNINPKQVAIVNTSGDHVSIILNNVYYCDYIATGH